MTVIGKNRHFVINDQMTDFSNRILFVMQDPVFLVGLGNPWVNMGWVGLGWVHFGIFNPWVNMG